MCFCLIQLLIVPLVNMQFCFFMRETEAREKPTENTAAKIADQWRVVFSCELQTLCCLTRIPSYTLFPRACNPFPTCHANLPMPRRNIYIGTGGWEEVLELLPPAIEHVWSHGVHLLTQIWCQNDNSCPLCRNKNKLGSGWVQQSKVAY